MDTHWPYNTRLEGKILFYRKSYSFCKLLDGQKVLNPSFNRFSKSTCSESPGCPELSKFWPTEKGKTMK